MSREMIDAVPTETVEELRALLDRTFGALRLDFASAELMETEAELRTGIFRSAVYRVAGVTLAGEEKPRVLIAHLDGRTAIVPRGRVRRTRRIANPKVWK